MAIVLLIGIITVSIQYSKFVDKTVYQESVSHLTEMLHQSDTALNELVNKNITYLHMWSNYLQNISNERNIRNYIEKVQKETGFSNFYFLSSEGNYKTVDGETGYLGLQGDFTNKVAQGKDIVMNAVLPGKPQMLVFACPEIFGKYDGFEYDAIAIAYYNSDIVKELDITAFNGAVGSYVIHSDGRIVIDHAEYDPYGVYNLLAFLREYTEIPEAEILSFENEIQQGHKGAMLVELDKTKYYLLYEAVGIQDWTMVGIVPAAVVNAGMNELQHGTIFITGAIIFGIALLIITVIIKDNTSRLKRKDTEILYQNELFTKLSMNVDDVFLMLDAKTFKADYVSPNAERLLGITAEQIKQDKQILKNLHAQDSEKQRTDCLDGLSTNEQREWEFEYIHQKSGEHRWFHDIAICSNIGGKKKYILVMSDRTSDRKINQALSKAVRDAEAANRAKSNFLSDMSHDIRTPMNAIIGFTTLAARNFDDKEKVRDYLSKTLSAGNHLLSLVNDILDMSRIESGKMQLEETEINFTDVLKDLKSIVSEEINKKQIDLHMGTEDVINENVYCDKTRLNQVLLNLMSNAIKFTQFGGAISVRIKQLSGIQDDKGLYEIRVKDNGIGMSPEFAEKIFKPFERERSSTASKIQGTGLGMAITKNIVDMMGGTIELRTEKDAGSEFIIRVALRIKEDGCRSGKKSEGSKIYTDSDYKNKRILLVEDNELNREIAETILVEHGFKVDEAENGAVALSKLKASMPGYYDVILMDIQMPVMDGYETTKKIRALEDPELSGIRILAMTANAFDEDKKKALEFGMDGFLTKPIIIEDLIKAIQKLL